AAPATAVAAARTPKPPPTVAAAVPTPAVRAAVAAPRRPTRAAAPGRRRPTPAAQGAPGPQRPTPRVAGLAVPDCRNATSRLTRSASICLLARRQKRFTCSTNALKATASRTTTQRTYRYTTVATCRPFRERFVSPSREGGGDTREQEIRS